MIFRHICLLVVASLVAQPGQAGDVPNIGSGDPGLKVATRSPDAIVIYRDEASTVGIGLLGGMRQRDIRVLVDQNYHFSKSTMAIPEQLYPFGTDAAFTTSGGGWSSDFKHYDYSKKSSTLYRVVGGQVRSEGNALEAARVAYGLDAKDIFLGLVGSRIFYWRTDDPSRLVWRSIGDRVEHVIGLSRGVIDLLGVTRGIEKDIGLVVFRKSPGLIHYSPYTYDFLEFTPDSK